MSSTISMILGLTNSNYEFISDFISGVLLIYIITQLLYIMSNILNGKRFTL